MDFLAKYKPKRKKRITDSVVPLPFPNKDPIKMNKKIILDDRILKFIPNVAPMIIKIIINKNLNYQV